jgi:bifunctional DNase/RNase
MSNETAVEMFVGGLLLDRNTQAPVVILKDEKGSITLPIWIGLAEATSIASSLNQLPVSRPLTHDLMHDVLAQIGVVVQRIIITELKESTYYAELVVALGDKIHIFDTRPSDAIALALRFSAPIFVTAQVLEQAKVVFQLALPEGDPVPPAASSEEESMAPQSGDFTHIEKDKWIEILNNLAPDDFKYKM